MPIPFPVRFKSKPLSSSFSSSIVSEERIPLLAGLVARQIFIIQRNSPSLRSFPPTRRFILTLRRIRLQPCHSPRVQFNVDTFSTSRIVESSQCERGSSPLRADTAGAYGRKSMDGKVVRYCNGEICRSWASCRRVRIRKTLLIEIHPPYVLQRGPQQFSPTYQLTCLYRMAPCQSVKEHCRNCARFRYL